jgi:catechol 2,3-dioxygenase-like lactoylglutathione lyase family enzyme
MITRLAVISIWAEDVVGTAHFYRDVLGLALRHHHAGRPHFDLGGSIMVILQGKPRGAENTVPERFPILAFAVDDLDAAITRLKVHQVELPWGVEENENSRWVMFHDPGGNLIELVQ